jgi:hypothetical protein
MSKAKTEATSHRVPAGAGSKQGTLPARRKPGGPARPVTTQDFIARIWDTLEWRKTLQMAFIISVTGIMVTLMLAGLGLLVHAVPSMAAAWPVGASLITVTVTCRAARHRQR